MTIRIDMRYKMLFLATMIVAILAGSLLQAHAQEKLEAVSKSRLTGISLPANAKRLIDKEALSQIAPRLEEAAQKNKKRASGVEVLLWTGAYAESTATIKAVEEALKKAEYEVEEKHIEGDAGVESRALAAVKGSKQIIGFTVINADYVVLGWCQMLDPKLDAVSSSPVADTEDKVLAAGDPDLTQQMENHFVRFLEWALDAAFTGEQRERMHQTLIDAWKGKDKAGIAGVVQLLKLHDQIMALPEENRTLLLAKVQPQLLTEWRKQPQKDELVRWALAIYDAAHQPIVAGNPPLTRQICDAYAEVTAFTLSEVSGKPFEATKEYRDHTAKALSANYGQLSEDQKLKLAQFPLVWAALRTAWPKASEEERDGMRRQWAVALQKMMPKTKEVAAAEKALAELQAMGQKAKTTQVQSADMLAAAKDMDIVAIALRQLGGVENETKAGEYEQMAQTYRQAAQSASVVANHPAQSSAASGKTLTSHEAFQKAMAMQQRQHNAYVFLHNISLTSHVGTMNMINIMGGSPYRYSVR